MGGGRSSRNDHLMAYLINNIESRSDRKKSRLANRISRILLVIDRGLEPSLFVYGKIELKFWFKMRNRPIFKRFLANELKVSRFVELTSQLEGIVTPSSFRLYLGVGFNPGKKGGIIINIRTEIIQ